MNDYVLNKIEFAFDSIDDAFPKADPGVVPFGHRVLVQIRTAKKKTRGGLILPEDTRETERWNTQVAKVIAVGPLAYHSRDTGAPWPEGSWAHPGDYVRVPKYGGDKWSVQQGDEEVLFVIFSDLDLIGRVSGDPMRMKAFI